MLDPDTCVEVHTFGATMKLLAADLAEMGMDATAGDVAKCAFLLRLLVSTPSREEVLNLLAMDEDKVLAEAVTDAAVMRAVMP